MATETKILIWWLLFGGTHILGSMVPVRTLLIRTLSLPGFKALYSLVSFATFIPLCRLFFADKHAGAVLFAAGSGASYAAQALMLLSLIVLVQGLVTTNPLTSMAEMTGWHGSGARGVQRVTRHPQNLAFVLFGLAHCIANPFAGDWVFFGGFVLFGIVSAIHQDRRSSATGGEAARRFLAETSLVPFGAIVSGKQRFAPRELSFVALIAAVVLFAALRYIHGSVLGGFGPAGVP